MGTATAEDFRRARAELANELDTSAAEAYREAHRWGELAKAAGGANDVANQDLCLDQARAFAARGDVCGNLAKGLRVGLAERAPAAPDRELSPTEDEVLAELVRYRGDLTLTALARTWRDAPVRHVALRVSALLDGCIHDVFRTLDEVHVEGSDALELVELLAELGAELASAERRVLLLARETVSQGARAGDRRWASYVDGRIEAGQQAGQQASKASCRCERCSTARADAERAVEQAVARSREKARGGQALDPLGGVR